MGHDSQLSIALDCAQSKREHWHASPVSRRKFSLFHSQMKILNNSGQLKVQSNIKTLEASSPVWIRERSDEKSRVGVSVTVDCLWMEEARSM